MTGTQVPWTFKWSRSGNQTSDATACRSPDQLLVIVVQWPCQLEPFQFRDEIVRIWERNFACVIELRDLVRRKRPSGRTEVVFELLDPARTDDRRGHTRLLQKPIDCHLRGRPVDRGGDLMQGVQGSPSLLIVVSAPLFAPIFFFRQLDARSFWRCSHPSLELPGKPPAPERAPRDDSQSFPHAQRNQLPFGAAAQ